MSALSQAELLTKMGRLCYGHALHLQINTPDPLICAKLYWPIGKARWYIAGYNPESRVAFGLVTGMGGADEWGYFSVDSLLETKIAGVMPAMIDEEFNPVRASILGIPTRDGAAKGMDE